jgi:hypothetical protein
MNPTDDDKFFERLRADAAGLRYRPDDATLARIRARIHERITPRPGVLELLAAWFRPLAATVTAVVIAAVIGVTAIDRSDAVVYDEAVEISMAGGTYSVGE